MKFGKTDNPESIDFNLPEDHPGTVPVLKSSDPEIPLTIHVGCAKWNRQELKGFYPRGTKDELVYYASQFNAIELNATFYRIFPEDVVKGWYEKVPHDFRFFPKVYQNITHIKWLNGVESLVEEHLGSIVHFQEKLGTSFLQLKDGFSPKYFDRIEQFIGMWPREIPLAIELRHTDWYNNPAVANELYQLFEANSIANVLVDTAGRRDLLHMRMTTNEAFVRFVGANHPSDYDRLDEWIPRLKQWSEQGLRRIHFFVHQNEERESPVLAAHFIEALNRELGCNLTVPVTGNSGK